MLYKVFMCLYRVYDPENYEFCYSCTVDGEEEILPYFEDSGYSIALEDYAINNFEIEKDDFIKRTKRYKKSAEFLRITAEWYRCDDWCHNNCLASMHCHILPDDDGTPIGEIAYSKKYQLRHCNP